MDHGLVHLRDPETNRYTLYYQSEYEGNPEYCYLRHRVAIEQTKDQGDK